MATFTDFADAVKDAAGNEPRANASSVAPLQNNRVALINSYTALRRSMEQNPLHRESPRQQFTDRVNENRRAVKVRGTPEYYLARSDAQFGSMVRFFNTMDARIQEVIQQSKTPQTQSPATTVPTTTPAMTAEDEYWIRMRKHVTEPLEGMQKILNNIQEKGIKSIATRGIKFRDKGKDLVDGFKKVLSPNEWAKALKTSANNRLNAISNLFGRKTAQTTPVTPAASTDVPAATPTPKKTQQPAPVTGLLGRFTDFMKESRRMFEELPGVGAATSLLVLRASREQTKELVAIKKILTDQYKHDVLIDDKKADAKEEESFESRASKARIMPTFDVLKKQQKGHWLSGLVDMLFGGIIEGLMLRFGLKAFTPKGILQSITGGVKGRLGGIFGKIKDLFGKGGPKQIGLFGDAAEGGMVKKLTDMFKGGKFAQKFTGVLEWFKGLGKFAEKIPGMGKAMGLFKGVFGKLGIVIEWIGGLGKLFMKIPGVGRLLGAVKGIPVIGWAITAVMAIFDFFKGFSNAKDILGKIDVNLWDKISAGIGSILGGVVGIFDAISGMFGFDTKVGDSVTKAVSGFLSDIPAMVGKFFAPVIDGLTSLGDKIVGVFGFRSLQSLFDFINFSVENVSKKLKTAFSGALNRITKFISETTSAVFGAIKGKLTEWSDAIQNMGKALWQGITDTTGMIVNGVKGIAGKIGDLFVGIGNSVAQYLGFDSMKSAFESLKDRIVNVIGGIGSGIAKLLGFQDFDALITKVFEIKDFLMAPFTFIIEKMSGVIKGLGKVASFLGYDSKEFEKYEKQVQQARAAEKSGREKQTQQAKQATQQPQQVAPAVAKIPATPPASASTLETERAPIPTRLPAPAVAAQQEQTEPQRIPEGQSPGWVRPIMSGVTSDFGTRKHPVTGKEKLHEGTDYKGKMGDPVRAAGDGTVQLASSLNGYGNAVYINHQNGYQTRYAHLSAFAPLGIGQQVKAGQVIGSVGNTGIGTGPHLHFEVRKGWGLANYQTRPENPEMFFQAEARMKNKKDDQGGDNRVSVAPQAPPRDPSLMNRWSTPRNAVSARVGQMQVSAAANVPTATRPVMPNVDINTGEIRASGGSQGMNIQYAPGRVPPEIAQMAVKMEKETGVPASVTIAQWATESGWGKKGIGNNAFGITKARRHTKSQTKTTNEDVTWDQFQKFNEAERKSAKLEDGSKIAGPWEGKKRIKMDREFADFDSLEDAFRDHSRLISSQNGPYKKAFDRYKMTGDVNSFIQEMAPTYATDRNYAPTISKIAHQGNVMSAVSAAKQMSVEPMTPPPLYAGNQPTIGRDILKGTQENASMARAAMAPAAQRGNVNVAPVTNNESNTTVIAELRARNAENTHNRILNREYSRT